MQVWNVLHAARWKYRTQKLAKNRHLGTIAQMSSCIFAIKARIDNWKKTCFKQQYILYMFPQWGELKRPTSGWDRSGSLGHPSKFQRLLRLGRITTWHSSIERQPNFAALNREHHLYSAGRLQNIMWNTLMHGNAWHYTIPISRGQTNHGQGCYLARLEVSCFLDIKKWIFQILRVQEPVDTWAQTLQ